MTYVYENRADGRHTTVHVPDDTEHPNLIAARTIARRGDDWELVDIERYTDNG